MHHQLTEVLTTILIKFNKVTILLPINKSTTIHELKQSILKIIQNTLTKSNHQLKEIHQFNQFDLFRQTPHQPSSSSTSSNSNWILLSNDSLSLIELGFKEAEVLGLGFLNSNGICSEPNIQVWIESEINQEQ
ncbi:hypothetical protein DFH28DRAFT_30202 [Melampsora americana]|nr:hypothetical protein DFH28DRAFT_30202 [Melampsora americana]